MTSSVGMMTFPTEWKVIKFYGCKPPTRLDITKGLKVWKFVTIVLNLVTLRDPIVTQQKPPFIVEMTIEIVGFPVKHGDVP